MSGLLGKTSQQNQFKLEALTEEFFEPLEEILGSKQYFLSDAAPSSLDCLALGHLALASVPDLQYPWLRDAMQAKSPRLTAYAARMRPRCFGSGVEVGPALSGEQSTTSPLPWQAPERTNLCKVGSTILNTLADATPIVRDVRNHNRLREAAESSDSGLSGIEKRTLSQYATGQKKDTYLSIAMVAGGVAALVGYALHVGLFSIKIEREEEEEELQGGGQGVNLDELDLKAGDFLT